MERAQHSQDLAGYAAFVTGGGSGIGLACATRLAAEGATVTITGRSPDRLAAGVAAIEAAASPGATVRAVPADVTDEAALAAAVAAATEATGRLDGIVISAGGSETIGPLTQVDVEAWRRTVDLNLTGTMLTIKHGARVMARQGGGSIVAISSVAGAVSHRWFGAYGPAKAGMDMLCKVAADELGASGIRVNTVRPGLTRTDLVEPITAPGPALDDYLACTPLGRIGEPEDVAALVRFLLGPEASWITGENISVDGGHAVRRGPDISGLLEGVFGADGLRGLVTEG
ncbi:MAG TPA: SDR family oxidoreductase [Acidimicrobiales bacterium]|nr:SDR family oxidoreductase [Acidimicrobiales bacterium]